MSRVANVRAERGDLEGANRARKIASKMEGGLGLGLGFWSVGWDYAKNYAWRSRDVESSNEILRAVSDANELLGLLKELGGVESEKERAKWVYQNYQRVLDASKSILRRLLVVFARSGPLREIVLIVQKEADGDLLRDCLEVGVNDLKGLLKVAKDIILGQLLFQQVSSLGQHLASKQSMYHTKVRAVRPMVSLAAGCCELSLEPYICHYDCCPLI
ncbi:hypothetical protein MRB53_035972 [Persea americana]|uniref:Uncharacterized protein n=1 Tax=Persea americana TaxID=3435 RepID=A0ACC2K651_PERAE|nr:hypothetical protein MRB53_035972 [Persea americana]